jgi:hypothetical protein
LEPLTPLLAVGLPVTSSGGQATAQLPEHLLFPPVSFLNRYKVRPRESTRIFPKPVRRTLTVARGRLRVIGAAMTGRSPVLLGCVVPAFAMSAPPTTARAVSGITAALARKVMGVRRVMSLLRLGRSTVAATGGDRITRRVVRIPENLVVARPERLALGARW